MWVIQSYYVTGTADEGAGESVGKEGQVSIDNMQFGFMPGKGTTDAIFIM